MSVAHVRRRETICIRPIKRSFIPELPGAGSQGLHQAAWIFTSGVSLLALCTLVLDPGANLRNLRGKEICDPRKPIRTPLCVCPGRKKDRAPWEPGLSEER